jgi:hypothetical protein
MHHRAVEEGAAHDSPDPAPREGAAAVHLSPDPAPRERAAVALGEGATATHRCVVD